MFYAFLQMDGTPVHLLTQHKHNGARSASAQTTGWRKADTWRLPRTKIGACKEIPKWQTWASLWPHSNLLWKQRLKKKQKKQWAHAAMIKNVLRLSEAFSFKLNFWEKIGSRVKGMHTVLINRMLGPEPPEFDCMELYMHIWIFFVKSINFESILAPYFRFAFLVPLG